MMYEEKIQHATALLRYFPESRALMCSFGKDSMVLLHLIREVLPKNPMLCHQYPMPIIHHRQPWFPAKYEFAESVIRSWTLEVYDYHPIDAGVKVKPDMIELVSRYQFGDGAMDLPMNIVEPITRRDFACGLQWVLRPRQVRSTWNIRTVYMGHKSSDVDQFEGHVPLKHDAAKLGGVNLVFPLRHWTDEDVWCLPYESIITTDVGDIPIGELIEKRPWHRIQVMGSNGWSDITAVSQQVADEVVTVKTKSKTLVASINHRVYTVNHGWKKIQHLTKRDDLLILDESGSPIVKETMAGYAPQGCSQELSDSLLASIGMEGANIETGSESKHDPSWKCYPDNIHENRGSILGRHYRRRGNSRSVFTKDCRSGEIRNDRIHSDYQYECSTIGICQSQITGSNRSASIFIGNQNQIRSADTKLSKSLGRSRSMHSVYDCKAETSRIGKQILPASVIASLQIPLWRSGNRTIQRVKKLKWLREKPIEIIRERRSTVVFDIQTGSHDFVANGVLVHNSYIETNHVPYDKRRYAGRMEVPDKWLNPDYLHACTLCVDPRNKGEVFCPKLNKMVPVNEVPILSKRPSYIKEEKYVGVDA